MSEKKNISDINWELLAKNLNNEADSREKLLVENCIGQSVENQKEMKNCQNMLEEVDNFYKSKSFDSKMAWNSVHSKINPVQLKVLQHKQQRKEKITQFYKYAAILIVAILLGSVGYYIGYKNQIPLVFNQIVSAENQVLNEYILPDGSIVALNSDSKLEFPKQFASDVREVTITGEAFFDVEPNPEKPFVINARGTQIRVLGTSFNVRAYPNTETVEVVVKTGKVQVIQKNNEELTEKQEVILIPGEKGTLFYESKILEKSENMDVNFLAWKTNDIIFIETPLSEVIKCLEKVYHIEVDVKEPELEELKLTAHFDKKPIDFVLDVVRLTFNLELTGENEHFALSSRTNKQVKL
jgi:ferric-dicitrate binding protein FerR (iron transport regulator)